MILKREVRLGKMVEEICIIGSSIVWGKHDPQAGGWANRLRNFFDNARIGEEERALVYPLGIPGDTTNFALERIKEEFEAREASIIIFALGQNDCSVNKKNEFRIGLEKYKKNLEKMTTIARKFTNKIIFIGLIKVDESKTTPVYWGDQCYYKNKNITEYNKAIEDFCKQNNLIFIPMFDVLEKEDLHDGLHPNAKGHEKIFKKVLPVVEKMIKNFGK